MKKKQKKKLVPGSKKIILLAVLIPAVLLVCLYSATFIIHYDNTVKRIEASVIANLMTDAVSNLKKDVPVDHMTGDLYFPESRLFLLNPKSDLKLTYEWHPAIGDSQEDLSVSLSPTPRAIDLYSASNVEEVFAAVPRLQACGRGVQILYNKATSDDTVLGQLKKVVKLQNGKDIYMYTEKECPHLDELLDLLSKVKSY